MSKSNEKDQKRYSKQKRKARSQIERYLSGERQSNKVSLYVGYVEELESEYGIRLKRINYLAEGVGRYKILLNF